VGEKGEVVDLKIFQSSGYAILDRASLKAVRNWRFEPARRGPRPIAMWVKVPVRFKLE
jgi:protein TonB